MATIGIYRNYVRECVAMANGYGCTEEMIFDSVNERVPGKADLSEVRDAVEWNLGKNYIKRRKNEDTEEYEWIITEDGKAKEAVG